MVWTQLPNVISGCRLAATPILLWFALGGHRDAFTWLLLACLLSDIVDGLIARMFRLESTFGAFLDSTADDVVTLIGVVGIVTYQWDFVVAHAMALSVMVACNLSQSAVGLLRYGRLPSFHCYSMRVAAYAQGTFVMSLFIWGYTGWLFHLTFALTCAAYLENFVLLAVLPQWTHDVRGLYWVLKARRRSA
jgi:CDP-diacylglycerol--glycerol-3-phosphate 3-phosphatidyltransferase